MLIEIAEGKIYDGIAFVTKLKVSNVDAAPVAECNFTLDELSEVDTPVVDDEADEESLAEVDAELTKSYNEWRQLLKWLYGVYTKTNRAEFLLAGPIFARYTIPRFYEFARRFEIDEDKVKNFLSHVGKPNRKGGRFLIHQDERSKSWLTVANTEGDNYIRLDIPAKIRKDFIAYDVFLHLPEEPLRFGDRQIYLVASYLLGLVKGKKVKDGIVDILKGYAKPPNAITTPAAPIDERQLKRIPLRLFQDRICYLYNISDQLFWKICVLPDCESFQVSYGRCFLPYMTVFRFSQFNSFEEIIRPQLWITLDEAKDYEEIFADGSRPADKTALLNLTKELYDRGHFECLKMIEILTRSTKAN